MALSILCTPFLRSTQRVMGFRNGTNEEFLRWFYESVELFHELTANITDDERRKLTSDPGILKKKKNHTRGISFINHFLFTFFFLIFLLNTASSLTNCIVA